MTARTGDAGAAGTAAEGDRTRGAVQFRDGHHDRALHRQETAIGFAPLMEGLKFQRVGGEIRHVEGRQYVLRRLGIVVGGAPHQRKSGQRDQRVDHRHAVPDEEFVDRRPRIEAGRKRRNDAQTARLERGDHAVIMRGVARKQVGAQHEDADGAFGTGREGQVLRALAIAAFHSPVIDADLRIRGGRRHLRRQAEPGTRT